ATDDVGGEVRVTGDGAGNLNGKPFAAMKTDLTLSNLLGEGGAPRTGSLPTLRGEVRLNAMALDTVDKVFAGALGASGLVLARDVGPSAEVLLLAASNPQAG